MRVKLKRVSQCKRALCQVYAHAPFYTHRPAQYRNTKRSRPRHGRPDATARGRTRRLARTLVGAAGFLTATDEAVSVPSTKAAELAPLTRSEAGELLLGAALLLFAQPQRSLCSEHCGIAGGDKRDVQPAALGDDHSAGLGHSRESERYRQQAHSQTPSSAVGVGGDRLEQLPMRL